MTQLRFSKSFLKARKKRGAGPAIVSKNGARITSENISKIHDNYHTKKGFHVLSHEKIVGKIPATQVLARFATRDLLKAVSKYNLHHKEKRILESLINPGIRNIPGTQINIRSDQSLLILELLNRLGEKKTYTMLKEISNRAKAVKMLAMKEEGKKGIISEAFHNIHQTATLARQQFEMDYHFQKNLLGRIDDLINERKKELEALEEMSVPNKRTHIETIRRQIKGAIIEKVRYQANNGLPIN